MAFISRRETLIGGVAGGGLLMADCGKITGADALPTTRFTATQWLCWPETLFSRSHSN